MINSGHFATGDKRPLKRLLSQDVLMAAAITVLALAITWAAWSGSGHNTGNSVSRSITPVGVSAEADQR